MATSAQDLMDIVAAQGYDRLAPLQVEECILAAIASGGGGGSGAVTQGIGDPVAAPSDPSQPAIYTNLSTSVIWTWDVTNQIWI